ncbi:MAG: DUF1667 domain-containing protein [Clostridiales bacterium]|nr:DUF1667 domain-containing protein [Clostridiales bacterium]
MKELICINCPLGCRMNVDDSNIEDIKVTGNTCLRGVKYAVSEVTAPKRMVTSSVPVTGSSVSRVSVKTTNPVPKEKIFDVLKLIKKVHAKAPVAIGTVLYPNICDGVDLVATSGATKLD